MWENFKFYLKVLNSKTINMLHVVIIWTKINVVFGTFLYKDCKILELEPCNADKIKQNISSLYDCDYCIVVFAGIKGPLMIMWRITIEIKS